VTNYELVFLIAVGSVGAGFLGALTGLGGGVVIIPMLTLLFGVDLRYAIGASLVSVIATSSGAAAAYVKEGYSNLRVGMFLEVATTVGAVAGAYLAVWLNPSWVGVIFGVVLLYSAWHARTLSSQTPAAAGKDWLATKLGLDGVYPSEGGWVAYQVLRVPLGFVVMLVAGILSGLLGIGSGAVKVLAMDQVMGLPFKVSTTTSNFMIGVTAAASAGIYLNRGYIDPVLAMPVMLGVLGGATAGAAVLGRSRPERLRTIFGVVIAVLAIQMIVKGLRGGF
jgi:uncharacterized membrane protein YfcA